MYLKSLCSCGNPSSPQNIKFCRKPAFLSIQNVNVLQLRTLGIVTSFSFLSFKHTISVQINIFCCSGMVILFADIDIRAPYTSVQTDETWEMVTFFGFASTVFSLRVSDSTISTALLNNKHVDSSHVPCVPI